MSITSPSVLKAFLDKLDVKAKKSLSQNFLIDGNIVQKILNSAEVSEQDLILEIGPGPGAVTEALLNRNASVIAVEMDRIFARELTRFAKDDLLNVYESDILKFPLKETIEKALHEKKIAKAKVVANLPYHLTTPILSFLLSHSPLFSSITVMVQKEVAERMTAQPGGGDYSSLTVFLNFYSDVRKDFTVKKSCFFPAPNVDSAIVTLFPKQPPQVDEEGFFRLMRTAFQHRRKMLKSSLRELYQLNLIEEALQNLSIDPYVRPEVISLEQFVKIYQYLRNNTHSISQ